MSTAADPLATATLSFIMPTELTDHIWTDKVSAERKILRGEFDEKGDQLVKSRSGVVKPAVKSKAADSPKTRPADKIIPVKMPGKVAGNSTFLIVYQ